MITIGFSTRKNNPEFIKHLQTTSGLKSDQIEIIEIINNGEFSLTECYEKILNDAKNDTIILCHDDISLTKSNKWGKKVLNNFENNDYSILGVAGTTLFPDNAIWWNDKSSLIGQVEHTDGKKTWTSYFSRSLGESIVESVVLDGVFLMVRRDRLKYNPDTTVQGFHFYDIDFTFGNHINGGKNGVVTNIKVLHKSLGATNDQWEENRLKFIEKWGSNLPKEITGDILLDKVSVNIKKEPKLGVIILNKSNNDILMGCIKSIHEKSSYDNLKIYIGDTGSTEDELDKLKDELKKYPKVSLHNIGKYNFGANNNKIVNEIIDGDTELLLFCNNDIELINDAISQMVDKYLKNKMNVGTIGCRLHYKNNRIQHAGIMMYTKDSSSVGVTHIGLGTNYSYGNNDSVVGNTGAFLMISKVLFKNIGGFNENYIECFEDVELNLSTIVRNKTNYIINTAVAYHYESLTRNLDNNKIAKLQEDYKERLWPFITKHIFSFTKYIKRL